MDALLDWICELNKSDKFIIVEGRNDKKALAAAGVKNEIGTLEGKALFEAAEEFSKNKRVVILTDLDREGKKLYGALSTSLQSQGCEIDNKFRGWLFKHTKLRQIEGFSLSLGAVRTGIKSRFSV